jgi:hypothetical protein
MKKQLTPHEVERLRYVEGDVRCVLYKCRGTPRRAGSDPETGCNSPRLKAAVHSIVRIQSRHHRGDAGCSGHLVALSHFHRCYRFTVGGNPGRALIKAGL